MPYIKNLLFFAAIGSTGGGSTGGGGSNTIFRKNGKIVWPTLGETVRAILLTFGFLFCMYLLIFLVIPAISRIMKAIVYSKEFKNKWFVSSGYKYRKLLDKNLGKDYFLAVLYSLGISLTDVSEENINQDAITQLYKEAESKYASIISYKGNLEQLREYFGFVCYKVVRQEAKVKIKYGYQTNFDLQSVTVTKAASLDHGNLVIAEIHAEGTDEDLQNHRVVSSRDTWNDILVLAKNANNNYKIINVVYDGKFTPIDTSKD